MTLRARPLGVALLAPLLAVAVSSPLAAQAFANFELSFSNPGARSLGFGGAFVALADDATAAYANPAGLVQIARTEVSVEARSWRYLTPYTRGGRAFGAPTGVGLDTVAEPLSGESRADLAGLSYVSWVYPRKRWSIAVFQHQLANFEFDLETQGVFAPGSGPLGAGRTVPQRGRLDTEIVTHGVAVAFRPRDELSFGVGVSHFAPDISIAGWDFQIGDGSPQAFFEPAPMRSAELVQRLAFSSRGDDWRPAAGFLWRFSERWTVGGVYRAGPEVRFEVELEAGPAHPALPDGFRQGIDVTWRFPGIFGLGLGYRSRDGRWTGSFEWKRVEYSSIFDSLLPVQREGVTLEDGDELHLGAEYAFFAGRSVLAVRAGLWHDPDHEYGPSGPDALIRALRPGGADELHLATGLGVAFDLFQLDLGLDLSERIDTASLSVIYSP